MNLIDASKMKFMSSHINYYYNVMPFGLINASATYQQFMNDVFGGKTEHDLEVYIDDMIMKMSEEESHASYLEDIVGSVMDYNTCLIPVKCLFDIQALKFLGFMLTKRGIKSNIDKCKAIIDMRSPFNVKEA